MNSKTLAALFAGIILASCTATKTSSNDLATSLPIETSINLSKVENDKAPVIINPGRFTTETVTYRIPKVVQGTYSVSNFGKYIDDFKALDYKGNELTFTKTDTNTWTISNAKQLDKITYLVNDTYDTEVSGRIGSDNPFSPGGTNIEPDNYVLNLTRFYWLFRFVKK